MPDRNLQENSIVTFLHMKVEQSEQEQVPLVYCTLTPTILQEAPDLAVSTLAQNNDHQQEESFLILSYWANKEGYQQWESSDEHRRQLRPLVSLGHGLRAEAFYYVG